MKSKQKNGKAREGKESATKKRQEATPLDHPRKKGPCGGTRRIGKKENLGGKRSYVRDDGTTWVSKRGGHNDRGVGWGGLWGGTPWSFGLTRLACSAATQAFKKGGNRNQDARKKTCDLKTKKNRRVPERSREKLSRVCISLPSKNIEEAARKGEGPGGKTVPQKRSCCTVHKRGEAEEEPKKKGRQVFQGKKLR